MKRILISCSIIFLLLIIPSNAKAILLITGNVTPSNAWLGEGISLSLECSDDQNLTIAETYVNITGPGISFPRIDLYGYDSLYSTVIDSSSLNGRGRYDVTFNCKNNNSDFNFTSAYFIVSELISGINAVKPSPAYIGDSIEIDTIVKKDDTVLSSDVSFQVYLNGQETPIKYPLAYGANGWMLKVDAPSSEGVYNIEVVAKYEAAQATATSTIEIKEPLQFELIDIDKLWVKPSDNITMTFRALFKGQEISLKSEYFNIQINSVNQPIQEISRSGGYSYVKIVAPQLSPGSYDMKIRFAYMASTKEFSRTIEYVVPINGMILDSGNKSVYTQMKFTRNGTERLITTDSSGSYSNYLPIGIYSVQLIFPSATLYLSNVIIDSFDNPIRFDHPAASINIPGIQDAGVFVFEVALSYQDAYIEMKYDDSRVSDESRINVYKCKNWNFGNRICSENWTMVNAETDSVRNFVKLNTTSLSAYVIGYRKTIRVNSASDKDVYNLKDLIKIKGLVEDDSKNPVGGAEIKVSIQNTSISASTKSDPSGIFSLEFLGPNQEGDYNILLTAEKLPYFGFNQTIPIKVVKSEGFSVAIADTIRVRQGENFTAEASLISLGQTDYSNLTISLNGVPREYYTLSKTIDRLLSGEEKKIPITFTIPEDASKTTYSATLRVESSNFIAEQTFALTITTVGESNSNTQPTGAPSFTFPIFNLPTAKIVLPAFSSEIICISLFAIASFSFAYIMKRRKNKNIERPDIKNLLLDIRREVSRELNEKER